MDAADAEGTDDYDSSAKACDMSCAEGVDPNEHDADRLNAISQRLAGPHLLFAGN